MAEEKVTEQEILDEVPAEETPVAERPDHIPEKFWKDGKADYDEMAKSYTQLETYVGGKEETLREKIIEELANEHAETVPEKYELPKLPEGITEEMVQENPMYSWWQETAKTNGMNQEEYEAGINAYVEMMQSQQPDIEKEMEALGENANSRIDAVNAWASKNFPPEEYEAIQYSLGASASGIQALERIMEMNKTGVRSEQFTQPEKQLTMADARAMMQDKRYYDPKYRDDAYVAKVDAAFRMLTK
tara:strand:- start:9625 stop:10362 length:738 start_codon:yes stop_codon:yes gene_type:complete